MNYENRNYKSKESIKQKNANKILWGFYTVL